MTHLLFLFRQASHGRSLRPLEVVVGLPAFIAFGLGAGRLIIRLSAAAMGIGVKFSGKFATAADAILGFNHSGGKAEGNRLPTRINAATGLSFCWAIWLGGVGRGLYSATSTLRLTKIWLRARVASATQAG